jgi:hypothetical protein
MDYQNGYQNGGGRGGFSGGGVRGGTCYNCTFPDLSLLLHCLNIWTN